MKKFAFLLLVALGASAYADFTVALDAGRLRQSAATAMPTGSLLILVAAGGDNAFSNSLAPGQYVSGNDVLLSAVAFPASAGAFDTAGGTDETNNTIAINTSNLPNLQQGDLLALRWFPQISYTQWQAGATPTAGQNYGTYNPLTNGNGMMETATQCPGVSANNPDCGSVWAVPSGGSTINLKFFTTDSSGGGTQTPSEGYASSTVTAVPEPATCFAGVLALGAIGWSVVRRRIKR